jgi:hypothetical protein
MIYFVVLLQVLEKQQPEIAKLTNGPSHTQSQTGVIYYYYYYCGPAESRLMHCSLLRIIVPTPLLVPTLNSRGAPRQTA